MLYFIMTIALAGPFGRCDTSEYPSSYGANVPTTLAGYHVCDVNPTDGFKECDVGLAEATCDNGVQVTSVLLNYITHSTFGSCATSSGNTYRFCVSMGAPTGNLRLLGTSHRDVISMMYHENTPSSYRELSNVSIVEIDTRGDNDKIFGSSYNYKYEEYLYGGSGHDTIWGDYNIYNPSVGGNDVIHGESGNDILSGGPGHDFIDGGSGGYVDFIQGGEGADDLRAATRSYIWGGPGNDYIVGSAFDDQIWGEDGRDLIKAGGGDDSVWGGPKRDDIYGEEGADVLLGENGYDRLSGGPGDDELYGGAGHDTLNGGHGQDLLEGEAGEDWLYGGLDSDTLLGGDGNDVLCETKYLVGSGSGVATNILQGDGGHDKAYVFTSSNAGPWPGNHDIEEAYGNYVPHMWDDRFNPQDYTIDSTFFTTLFTWFGPSSPECYAAYRFGVAP